VQVSDLKYSVQNLDCLLANTFCGADCGVFRLGLVAFHFFSVRLHYFDLLWICRTACCTTSCSKANSKSTTEIHTTSCRTSSRSYNKLHNLSHSKLHATISKSYSKSHKLLYNRSTANRSNGVRHLTVAR